MNRAERDAVEREVRRLIDTSPFELYDLRIGQDRSVHLYLDRKEGRLSVDDAARFNRFLRQELAISGTDVDSWSIEIESPGAQRALRTPRHYARHLGERIRLVRRDPLASSRVVTGILRSSDERGCRIEPEGSEPPLDIPFSDVSEARLDPKLPF